MFHTLLLHGLRRRMLKDTKNVAVTLYFSGSRMPFWNTFMGRCHYNWIKEYVLSLYQLMLVFDRAKMQTIPWGVCGFFCGKCLLNGTREYFKKWKDSKTLGSSDTWTKSNFTKHFFCSYLPISTDIMWLLILSNQPWEGLTGVECHTLQCSLLLSGFFFQDAEQHNATFCRLAKKLQHIALRNFIPQSLFIYICVVV